MGVRRASTSTQSTPDTTTRELCGHIFAVSAGLVGVCITVIGLFHLGSPQGDLRGIADNLIAADGFWFLASCLLAYLALRSRSAERRRRIERVADVIFLAGLTAMVLIGCLVAYELV